MVRAHAQRSSEPKLPIPKDKRVRAKCNSTQQTAVKLTCTPSIRPSSCSCLTLALAPASLCIPAPLLAAGVPATRCACGTSISSPFSSKANSGSARSKPSSPPRKALGSAASLSPWSLKLPGSPGEEVGRTRPPSAPAWEDD
jgi:hypothetical protein